MEIRDILVLLDKDSHAAGPYALSIAARLEAHLTAVALVQDRPIAGGLTELPHNLLDAMYEENRRAAEQALEPFQRAELSAVDTEIVTIGPSQSDERLFRWLARHFDLTIVQQPAPEGPVTDYMIEAALFGSGRPILLVPYVHTTPAQLGTVLIAWDESATAARAIGDALPLLGMADRVELVTVAEPRLGSDGPRARMMQHLSRHGIDVKFVSLASVGAVAEMLLSHAADNAADLIVMGGYGHSRLREFVLGGTTRSMLTSVMIPTLMSH